MIRDEFKDLDELRKKFNPLIVSKALNSAINKTTKKARTFISKELRKTYNVKAAKINKSLIIIKQSPGKDLIADRVLFYSGGRVSLINFGAKSVRIAGSKRRGVSVLIKKAGGRKIVKGKNGYGAFIAEGKNNNEHVFLRDTASRLPLKKMTGLSIAEMLSSGNVLDKINNFVGKEISVQLDHELEFFLTKAGAI